MNCAGRLLSGDDLDPCSLHIYFQDSCFVEYFNSFLLLPAFSNKIFYNESTDHFEEVFSSGIHSSSREREKEGGLISTPDISTASTSMLYLTDDCMGLPLDKQQCWQWVLDHRLPLFLRSDLFSEYKLCKRLTAPQIIDSMQGQILFPKSGRKTLSPSPNQTNSPTITNVKEKKHLPSEDEFQDEGVKNAEAVLRASTSNILPSCKGSGSDQVLEDLQFSNEIGRSPKSPTSGTAISRLLQPSSASSTDQSVIEDDGGKKHAGTRKQHGELMLNASKSNIELRGIHDQQICLPSMTSSNSTCTLSWNVQPRSRSKSLTTTEDRSRRTTAGQSVSSEGKSVSNVKDATTARARSGRVRRRSQSSTFNGNDPEKLPSLLSTKRGMYSFWRFLQGTAGERSWLFWLDAERLKYCTTQQEQSNLLRGLRERYLSAGSPLELTTDTKFRMGLDGLHMGSMASIQSLQNTLVAHLKNYWCQRFLLHELHKRENKIRTRPHTCLGIIYTHQIDEMCCMNYPRMETPLVPTKTPTFHRISKRHERLQTAKRRSSRQRSSSVPTPIMQPHHTTINGMVEDVGERKKKEHHATGNKEKGRVRGGGIRRSSGIGRSGEGLYSREADGEMMIQESQVPTISSDSPSYIYISEKAVERKGHWFDGSSKMQHNGCTSQYPLPQSLRQSYACSPALGWNGDEEYAMTQSPTGFPASRSMEYHKLTKYTPRHLPKLHTVSTPVDAPPTELRHGLMCPDYSIIHSTSPHSQQILSLPVSSCHILSISGTPLLPPSPPHSSFAHMIQCLATENRKAGGYFIQYLQSLDNRVPLHSLLFWREVQDYKALFLAPKFSPAAVQIKAKALYSRYVAESAAQTLLLPPSFPSYISSLLHPPYDDLFDRVEEHVLGVLMVYWETLCKRDEAEFQKVETASISRAGSPSKHACKTSYTTLDELSEEVTDSKLNSDASYPSHFHITPRDTPLPSQLLSPHSASSSHTPSPLSPHLQTPTQTPPLSTKAVGLNDILDNSTELEHFKMFLNERRAAQHLMCWMDIEAFRGIPARNKHLRNLRAQQLREKYFTRKYLLGPDSPASKEAQRQIVAAGGGYSSRLPSRPKTPVFREAQKHVRAKLEKKWLSAFMQTPEYMARSGMVVDDREGKSTSENRSDMELKFAHSHKALLLRKALQEDSSRELFLQFLSTRNTSDSKLVADVEFWLEVQRFKLMCHSHSSRQVILDKLKAMQDCYFNSSVPPRLHIDVPQYMADQVLRKEFGPYIFRETQATVFRHLYGFWQDYQAMTHGMSKQEIETELHKMERQRKQLKKAAEERALKLELEQQQIPRFETAQEQEERLKRELEQQEFGEVAVNFTLVKPQPEYIYHTSIPGNDPDEHESSKCNVVSN